MNKQSNLKIVIPQWVATVYTTCAVILIPWTIYLAASLPTRHITRHWDVAWVGLDTGIITGFLITGFLAKIKSEWVIIFATITATFLLVDAWFDVLSSRPGKPLIEAIILAVIIEIPLSILSFVLAHKALKRTIS